MINDSSCGDTHTRAGERYSRHTRCARRGGQTVTGGCPPCLPPATLRLAPVRHARRVGRARTWLISACARGEEGRQQRGASVREDCAQALSGPPFSRRWCAQAHGTRLERKRLRLGRCHCACVSKAFVEGTTNWCADVENASRKCAPLTSEGVSINCQYGVVRAPHARDERVGLYLRINKKCVRTRTPHHPPPRETWPRSVCGSVFHLLRVAMTNS